MTVVASAETATASAVASAGSNATTECPGLSVAATTDFVVAAHVAAVVMLRQVSVETERFLVGLEVN